MDSSSNQFILDLGQEHITIQRRYEALGAFNDFLIAVWFLIGSFFFLNDSLIESGQCPITYKACFKVDQLSTC